MTSFDERAKSWDSDKTRVQRAWAVANSIRSALPQRADLTALEYGCGTGLLSFALQPFFSSITLADTSQGMLDVLAGKIRDGGIENMHPLKLDLASQPLPPEHFDVIYSLMTLHHLPETDTYLQKFNTLLKPRGSLFIADLEKEDGSFHGMVIDDVHRGFDRSVIQLKVENAGFTEIQFNRVFEVKKLVDGQEKIYPMFLMIANKKG